MYWMLIAATLLLQGGSPPWYNQMAADLEMAEAEELFVLDTIPPHANFRFMDFAFGEECGRLVRMLGCGRGECRELARFLVSDPSMRSEMFRPLVWATHDRDPHIRQEAMNLLSRNYPFFKPWELRELDEQFARGERP